MRRAVDGGRAAYVSGAWDLWRRRFRRCQLGSCDRNESSVSSFIGILVKL